MLSDRIKYNSKPILVLISLVMFSVIGAEELDVYDKIDKLVNQLEDWQNHSVDLTALHNDTINSEILHHYILQKDSIAPQKYRLQLSLPIYMGSLTTRINYLIDSSSNENQIKYIDNLSMTDTSFIYDDSIEVEADKIKNADILFSKIRNRFRFYRTLNLPEKYRADSIGKIATPIHMTVFGRDNIHKEYKSPSRWFLILQKLALNKSLYSGLVSLSKRDSTIETKFYISLTSKYAHGHHFLIIEEILRIENDSFYSKNYKVSFYPYVRSDNVLDIFKREEIENSKGVRINLD